MVAPRTYKHPPIAEAVIEFRFAEPLDEKSIKKAGNRLSEKYFYRDQDNGANFHVDIARNKIEKQTTWTGEKFSSIQRVDIAILRTTAFIGARLAPYCGWSEFIDRVQRDWQSLMKTVGDVPRFARIGIRFINRIDVPMLDTLPVDPVDFLTIVPQGSLILGKSSGYVLQLQRVIDEDGCALVLNSATIPSPLALHASFGLDIDISNDRDLPQKDAEIWKLIDKMRHLKNEVFESCITEDARRLFDR